MTPSDVKQPFISNKLRPYVLAVAALGALFSIIYVVMLVTSPSKPTEADPNKIGRAVQTRPVGVAPGGDVDPKDVWVGSAGKQLADLSGSVARQEKTNESVQQALAALTKRLDTQPAPAATPPAATPTPAPAPQPAQPQTPARAVTAPTSFPPGDPLALARASALPGASAVQALLSPPGPKSITVSLTSNNTPGALPNSAPQPNAAAMPKRIAGVNYLPIGFARATVLSGLDAPAALQAKQEPHPFLLRIDDLAMLPNTVRSDIKACFAAGAAAGDLASERAYMRGELMECIRNDGSVLSVKIDAYVVGEDGKNGMRGRLVSKQGQILYNALAAGVIAGIGKGIQSSSTTTSTSGLGTVTSVEPGKEFRAGIGGGVGSAVDRLSQFYISLAEKTFPVIEIDAGRTVDLVFKSGVDLPGGDVDQGRTARSQTRLASYWSNDE